MPRILSHHAPINYFVIGLLILAVVAIGASTAINAFRQPTMQEEFEALPKFKIQPQHWDPEPIMSPIPAESIAAKTMILVDETNGKVLADRNSRARVPMASTTKIMTAALAIEFANADSLITVPGEALKDLPADSALMGVSAGEKYTIKELLYGLMLNSGNDAAKTIAIAISGSEEAFARLMTAKAKQIGMQDTRFVNASGLDHENHYSTAYDLALLAHYAQSLPLLREVVATSQITLPYSSNHKQLYLENLNSLITSYPGATGIKPGNTGQAGNCLVATPERGGQKLIGVLLDTPGRNTNMAALFDLGFAYL